MMSSERRFYRLEATEKPVPGAYVGHWEMVSKVQPLPGNAKEITEMEWAGIQYFRTDDPRVLWVGVPNDMDLGTAGERIAERLGIVDIEDENLEDSPVSLQS